MQQPFTHGRTLTAQSAEPLGTLLKAWLTDITASQIKGWLRHGAISVNGIVCHDPRYIIQPGDQVTVYPHLRPALANIQVVYMDRDLIVINKPPGLLSVATETQRDRTAFRLMKDWLRSESLYVIHRLDQETSGALLFARTVHVAEKLKEQLAERKIERRYLALAMGAITPPEGTWSSHLIEMPSLLVRSTQRPGEGKIATTHYRVIQQQPRFCWLDIKLDTGRKHQIRVHCAEAGHPLLGDKRYGATFNPLKRLCLHAYQLAFAHPVTGREMSFSVPLPASFRRLSQ